MKKHVSILSPENLHSNITFTFILNFLKEFGLTNTKNKSFIEQSMWWDRGQNTFTKNRVGSNLWKENTVKLIVKSKILIREANT